MPYRMYVQCGCAYMRLESIIFFFIAFPVNFIGQSNHMFQFVSYGHDANGVSGRHCLCHMPHVMDSSNLVVVANVMDSIE